MIQDKSMSSRVFDIVIHVVVFIVVLVTILPVLHVAAISVSSSTAINQGRVSFYPIEFNLNAYKMVWDAQKVPRAFQNSVFYTVLGTAINLIMTLMMAYPLSKKDLTFRGFYTWIVTITMFFSGGMIPTFLLVNELGLYDTVWAMVLPGAISTWNLIIMRTFLQGLPAELEESAYLDGANDFQILFQIIIPLSKASIATIGMFYAVGHWNSWFNGLIYLKDSAKYPLQLILREIVLQSQMAKEMAEQGIVDNDFSNVTVDSVKYATLFISILPMLIIYPFIQKYFVKGVMIGSLKG